VALAEHPGCLTRSDLFRFYPAWVRSNFLGPGFLADRQPWLPYTATRFLKSILKRGSRVFEYGAGGSTLFFGSLGTELVSVEHDADWLRRTAQKMERIAPTSWRYHHVSPTRPLVPPTLPVTDPDAYGSTDEKFIGMSFEDYARAIDQYDDHSFDLVLIDGRARPACFKHAVRKVKFGGYLVLDNAERPAYSYVEAAAKGMGLPVREFWGPGPYARFFWRTIFIRLHPQLPALKVIVGSSGTAASGWISTEYPYVDLTSDESLSAVFPRAGVSAFLAEHVFEHLTYDPAHTAFKNLRTFLKPGGYMRIAVPDGYHADPEYIAYSKPGGYGPGSEDHKVMYNMSTLSALLEANGFVVRPLEWFDEKGKFHAREWDPKTGFVSRSTRFDERNRKNPTAYTSLIVDAVRSV
jgi:predicted SAM-dependent methyltransferase